MNVSLYTDDPSTLINMVNQLSKIKGDLFTWTLWSNSFLSTKHLYHNIYLIRVLCERATSKDVIGD